MNEADAVIKMQEKIDTLTAEAESYKQTGCIKSGCAEHVQKMHAQITDLKAAINRAITVSPIMKKEALIAELQQSLKEQGGQ